MERFAEGTVGIGSIAGWIAAVMVPSVAHAHVGLGQTSGFAHGLQHPLGGIDHAAAMLAVGLWSAQRGGRAVWAVPLGFVTVMAVGGIVGALGVGFPVVEPAIAVSVLLLGLAVAAAVRWSPAASVLVVAVFALFHGHAHGAEMPPTASGFAYGAGFVLATGFLHGVGISVGWWVQQCGKAQWLRYAGGGIALCGAYLLFR